MPEDGAICLHILEVIQKHHTFYTHTDYIYTSTFPLIVLQECKSSYKRKLSQPTTFIYAPKYPQQEIKILSKKLKIWKII